MSAPQGPFSVVPYDAAGRVSPSISIDHGGGGTVSDIWEAVRLALPPHTHAFALYAHDGTLVRIGMLPAETLTDDPDVTALAFDVGGNWLATGHADGNVRLWDVVTGDPLWTRVPADEPILGVLFVDVGPWVIAWHDDGPLLVFSQDDGNLLLRVEDPQAGPFTVVPSPEGRELACTGARVTRLTLPDGLELPPLDGDRGSLVPGSPQSLDEGIVWLAYLPDGECIVGVRAGQPHDEVVFWDRATGARTAAISGMTGVAACDLSPDGRFVALGLSGERTTVLLVDTARRVVAHTIETAGTGIHDLRFSRGSGALILHDASLGIVQIDAATGQIGAAIPEDDGAGFVFIGDEEVIPEEAESSPILVTHDGTGRIELTPLEMRGPFAPTGRSASADGGRYAAVPYATDNNLVTVYDLVTDEAIATLPHAGNVHEIWMSGDGTRVAVHAAGHVTVWYVPDAPASIERV
jgi:WD40 repeat protein